LAVFACLRVGPAFPAQPEPGILAAHLLYFLVKNHRFVDGNKRIAAALGDNAIRPVPSCPLLITDTGAPAAIEVVAAASMLRV
jgi:hypothetical protein